MTNSLDPVKLAVAALVVASVLMLVGLSIILWNNGQSRNLALAAGAIVGSLVLLATQGWFELRTPEEESGGFTAEVTIDRLTPSIGEWVRIESPLFKSELEKRASDALVREHATLFEGENFRRTTLSAQMIYYNLLAYVSATLWDWQGERRTLSSPTVGTSSVTTTVSKPHECEYLSLEYLHSVLRKAKSPFASASLSHPLDELGWRRCFPPGTTIVLDYHPILLQQRDSVALTIRNPICSVRFSLEGSAERSPLRHGQKFPLKDDQIEQLPGTDEDRWETRAFYVSYRIAFSRWRAQHSDRPKYEKWARNVVNGAREWFEGEPQRQGTP